MTANTVTTSSYTISTGTAGYVPKNYLTYTVPTTATSIIGHIDIPCERKREYKCAYCDTVHDHRTGKCENCGAPLGEAVEI